MDLPLNPEPADAAAGPVTVVETEVFMARPPREVFEFVTTPANWVRWHPATQAVDGGAIPLVAGETVAEHIYTAGRRAVVTWRVLDCQSPTRWVIESASGEGWARITYRLIAERDGTRFHRTLEYRLQWGWWRWANRWFLAPHMRRESRRALANLKRVLESQEATPG